MLCILAVPGWYKNILSQHNITIDPQPSWDSHAFHDNIGEVDSAQPLASRGLTLDEADDCHNLTFTWVQEDNTTGEKDAQLCILLSSATVRANTLPMVEPWCEPIMHRFDENHTRWVASDKNVILQPL